MINNKGKDMQNLTDTLMGLTISELAQVQETIKQIKTMKAKSALTVGGNCVVVQKTKRTPGVVEKLNQHGTTLQLMESDLEKNTEFRIKWPRGQLGSLPADSEQFMLIEDLYKQVEKLQATQEMNMTNKVNIEFLQKQMEKALEDIEKLKDSNREIKYTNGNGH